MDRRHFLQGSAALGGSLLTAVDRSALAAPVRIDVPARCRGAGAVGWRSSARNPA